MTVASMPRGRRFPVVSESFGSLFAGYDDWCKKKIHGNTCIKISMKLFILLAMLLTHKRIFPVELEDLDYKRDQKLMYQAE